MRFRPLRSRLRRALAVWCLVVVALLGAFAPVVSHAIVLARGLAVADPGVYICTSALSPHGVPPRAETGAPGDEHKSALSLAHCPFCLHGAERGAPPRHALQPVVCLPGTPPAPRAQPVFFYAIASVGLPPPRGPPVGAPTA